MPKFSIALICKDEAKTIPKLAESISGFLKDGGGAVILDTGSTDGTVELAKSLGLEVHEGRFDATLTERDAEGIGCELVKSGDRVFDFSAARNACAELVATDWVLALDADEEVEYDREELERLMVEPNAIIRCWISDGMRKWVVTRLYNRKKMSWYGMCHEGLQGQGVQVLAGESVLKITHRQHEKPERPTRISTLAYQALKFPTERNLFYYGRELTYRGLWAKAIGVLRESVMKADHYPEEKCEGLILIGKCYESLGNLRMAKDNWREAFRACPWRRTSLMRLAELAYGKADWKEVVLNASPALEIAKSAYVEVDSDFGAAPHKLLYPALWQTGNRESSGRHFLKALELDPTDGKLLNDKRFYVIPKISVCIPTLGRPEKLERCLKAIGENADWDHEVIVEHDDFEDRQGCPKTLAKAVEKATGDFIMFLGNDCIPQKGFMSEAMKVMGSLPDGWGLVALYDGRHRGTLATHWLASKKMLSYIDGYFFNPAYEHCYCDNELTERAKSLGRYAYAPLSVVEHDNAMVKGGELDDVLKIAYDKERLARDMATYERRKKVWSLPYTGERVVPDKMYVEPQTLAEHLARYNFAKGRVEGQVLDAPCGTGYGAELIGAVAGCDISQEAVDYAKSRYPKTEFFVSDLERPALECDYQTVTSFEGLEHLNDPKPFIEWVRTNAKTFIFSIPVNNVSKWHKHAYSVEQIKGLFSAFRSVEWFEQTGTEIKPLVEGSSPVFLIGIAES